MGKLHTCLGWVALASLVAACSAKVDVFGGSDQGGDGPGGGTGGVPGGGNGQGAGPGNTSSSSSNSSSSQSSSSEMVTSTGTGMGCPSGPNDDADMDGWSPNQGDCNDCDAALSPNNLEIVGNAIDDDCDGAFDNLLAPCDLGLSIDEDDPLAAASAIELCRLSTATNEWGIATASWVLADGTPPPAAQLAAFHLGHGLLEDFGDVVVPRAGATLLGLSNGRARDANDPDFEATNNGGKGYDSGFPIGAPIPSVTCPGQNVTTAHDAVALELSLRVPSNAFGFSFDSNFFSADWPAFVCSAYDDAFFAWLDPAPTGQATGQVARYANGNPVSLNGAPFDVCGCMMPPCMAGGQTYACAQGTASLVGTGFETFAATGWQTTTVPLEPGSTVTLRLGTYDAGDGIIVSTALVDAFRWHTSAVTLGTVASP